MSPSLQVVRGGGDFGPAAVEDQLDRAVCHIELEGAFGAVVVFPTVVFVPEKVEAEGLDLFPPSRGRPNYRPTRPTQPYTL